jgi:hypothetical protein
MLCITARPKSHAGGYSDLEEELEGVGADVLSVFTADPLSDPALSDLGLSDLGLSDPALSEAAEVVSEPALPSCDLAEAVGLAA